MTEKAEKQHKVIAIAGALLVHALFFLIFILIIFKTPLPPFPEGASPGIEIDFGNTIEGTGNTEADQINNSETSTVKAAEMKPSIAAEEDNSVVTNEAEPTISIVKKDKQHKKVENKVVAELEKPVEPSPSNELTNALNRLKNKNTGAVGGDGNSGHAGNSGDPNGSPDGNGTGGGGDGNGKFNLKGRKILQRPEVVDDSQEAGKVVVEIIVDETGKVIRANPGERGSTSTSAILYAKARQAALSAKFNASPDGMKEQKGTITFRFTLD